MNKREKILVIFNDKDYMANNKYKKICQKFESEGFNIGRSEPFSIWCFNDKVEYYFLMDIFLDDYLNLPANIKIFKEVIFEENINVTNFEEVKLKLVKED